jgi:hypothetical protein
MGGIKNACGILMETRRNIPFGTPNRRVDNNIKMDLKYMWQMILN